MKWLKSYWLPLSVLALLVMVDVTFPASHALFPLALIMWFEFASFSLVCFTEGGISTVEAEPEPDEPEEMWMVKRG